MTVTQTGILAFITARTGPVPPGAAYLSLHSASPGGDGSHELTAASYARVVINSAAAVAFPAPLSSWGPSPFFGLWTRPHGGVFLDGGPLDHPRTLAAGDPVLVVAVTGSTGPQTATRLVDLSDVTPGAPSDADLLTYDAASGTYTPKVSSTPTGIANGGGTLGFDSDGNLLSVGLPTADPLVVGAVWNNAGALQISAGA